MLRNHFNDYLGSIAFLAYTNIIISHANNKLPKIEKIVPILCCGIVCSVFWEGLMPKVLSYSTADFFDCIAYLFGAMTYWVIISKLK